MKGILERFADAKFNNGHVTCEIFVGSPLRYERL